MKNYTSYYYYFGLPKLKIGDTINDKYLIVSKESNTRFYGYFISDPEIRVEIGIIRALGDLKYTFEIRFMK